VTTLEEMVKEMEARYGKANRIWVLDRGLMSEENVEFLQRGQRRYIAGTPKSMLKRFQKELLADDWQQVQEGLEVRFCSAPGGGQEVFILCRSAQRRAKEQAIHERFERRIEEGLRKIKQSCRNRKQKPVVIAQRVGRLLGKNTRAAGLFEVHIEGDGDGLTRFRWLAEGGVVAGVGAAERRLLSVAEQCHRLDGGGALESLHSAHRGGSGVPHSQE
jgi:hypothetical protein